MKRLQAADAVIVRLRQVQELFREHFDRADHVARIAGSTRGSGVTAAELAALFLERLEAGRDLTVDALRFEVRATAWKLAEGCVRVGDTWSEIVAMHAAWALEVLAVPVVRPIVPRRKRRLVEASARAQSAGPN